MRCKAGLLLVVLALWSKCSYCWGFYAHKLVNYYAVMMLPPEMMVMYKKNLDFLSEHAVDPDKRRYAVRQEAPRHYIDLDKYRGDIPRKWAAAVERFSEDSLLAHGIVPWWVDIMQQRLTAAFQKKEGRRILKLSTEIGHYIADAHVPLHASSNHNGQLTNQHGIHGFWESRIPELLAESEWDFLIGKAVYIKDPLAFIWARVKESARAADSVLLLERKLNDSFPPDRKYAFENRNGTIVKQYSAEYTKAYSQLLNNMVERRFRESVFAVASFWYTAWVNAGQPRLHELAEAEPSATEQAEFSELNLQWKNESLKGRSCE